MKYILFIFFINYSLYSSANSIYIQEVRGFSSPSGSYVGRLDREPKTFESIIKIFTYNEKEEIYKKAFSYLDNVDIKNRIHWLISNSGDIVVVGDGEGNFVVQVLNISGDVKFSLSLEDIYSLSQRSMLVKSWDYSRWLCPSGAPTISGNSLMVLDSINGYLSVNLKTGEYYYNAEAGVCRWPTS